MQKQSPWDYSVKKDVPKKISEYSQENACAGVSLLIKLHSSSLQFIEKDTSAPQVFFYELYKVFKNTDFVDHVRLVASENNAQ